MQKSPSQEPPLHSTTKHPTTADCTLWLTTDLWTVDWQTGWQLDKFPALEFPFLKQREIQKATGLRYSHNANREIKIPYTSF